MTDLTWDEFKRVEIRVGKVVAAYEFPEARKPAYIIEVDFGEKIGIKKSSAQITDFYTLDELLGRQIVAVVNFPPKQIGPVMSEFLVLGAVQEDGKVVLLEPDRAVDLGLRIA